MDHLTVGLIFKDNLIFTHHTLCSPRWEPNHRNMSVWRSRHPKDSRRRLHCHLRLLETPTRVVGNSRDCLHIREGWHSLLGRRSHRKLTRCRRQRLPIQIQTARQRLFHPPPAAYPYPCLLTSYWRTPDHRSLWYLWRSSHSTRSKGPQIGFVIGARGKLRLSEGLDLTCCNLRRRTLPWQEVWNGVVCYELETAMK